MEKAISISGDKNEYQEYGLFAFGEGAYMVLRNGLLDDTQMRLAGYMAVATNHFVMNDFISQSECPNLGINDPII